MFSKRFTFAVQSMLEIRVEGISLSEDNEGGEYKNDVGIQKSRGNDDLFLTTPKIIRKNGYPCQIHKVITDDGYILTLHRIPHGKTGNCADNTSYDRKPVALLQPGAFCSSAIWVMSPVERALAFRLADEGYDVFLGNNRGTTYSKEHVSLSVHSPEYWDFSWHEIGIYDVPAVIDYILNLTSEPDLYYLGHSMGTTMFFVCMSCRPEYNSKIRLMSALAPVAFMEHLSSPVCTVLAPFVKQLDWAAEYLGLRQLFPSHVMMKLLGMTVAHRHSPIQSVLSSFLFLICGYNMKQLDKDLLQVILGHVPAGIATKCLVHYAQGINSGEFRQYNYGRRRNEEIYGQVSPPDYDLSRVTAPVALYYSNNDWLAATSDVHRLAYSLPNVVRKYLVPMDTFNHMDFLWALDSPSLLYETIEGEMRDRIQKLQLMSPDELLPQIL